MTISNLVLHAPTPLVELGLNENIVDLNHAASAMGFKKDTPIAIYHDASDEPLSESIRYQPASHLYRLRLGDSDKRCRIRLFEEGGRTYLWIIDQSEALVLAEKLRRLKSPDAKKSRQINQLSITALGYAELLDVVMQDNDTLSAEKLHAIRNYQSEISACLKNIHRLIEGGTTSIQHGQVLVAERHGALKDLVTELLQAEGYKVHAFSDADAAIAFCRLNGDNLQKAVVDETLIDAQGKSLINHLKFLQPNLNIIALVETEAGIASGGVPKPLDFQVLLEALID